MAYQDYRGQIAEHFKRRTRCGKGASVFYSGNRFWALETMGTEALPTVALDALVLRGTQDDADVVSRLATSRKFWSASAAVRRATMERHCDIDRLFGAYTPETLPSRYLRTYVASDRLHEAGASLLSRFGGVSNGATAQGH